MIIIADVLYLTIYNLPAAVCFTLVSTGSLDYEMNFSFKFGLFWVTDIGDFENIVIHFHCACHAQTEEEVPEDP